MLGQGHFESGSRKSCGGGCLLRERLSLCQKVLAKEIQKLRKAQPALKEEADAAARAKDRLEEQLAAERSRQRGAAHARAALLHEVRRNCSLVRWTQKESRAQITYDYRPGQPDPHIENRDVVKGAANFRTRGRVLNIDDESASLGALLLGCLMFDFEARSESLHAKSGTKVWVVLWVSDRVSGSDYTSGVFG